VCEGRKRDLRVHFGDGRDDAYDDVGLGRTVEDVAGVGERVDASDGGRDGSLGAVHFFPQLVKGAKELRNVGVARDPVPDCLTAVDGRGGAAEKSLDPTRLLRDRRRQLVADDRDELRMISRAQRMQRRTSPS